MNKRLLHIFVISFLLFFFSSSQAQDKDFKINTVVIDAGHGGKDPGNLGTGRYKTTEKDIALDVALQVGEYIKREFKDVKVLYTREKDVFIGLNERAQMANEAKADIFISIHCNSAANKSAYGSETFVLGLHKTEENLRIAQKENSVITMEDDYKQKYEGFDPNSAESIIALSMMQSAYLNQSIEMSARVQQQFKTRVGRRDRGVKQAGFLVIRKTTMPSILIELGFLTNPDEEDFLNSENGKVYMASAIYRAFKDYKNDYEKANMALATSVSEAVGEVENKVEDPVLEGEGKLEDGVEDKKLLIRYNSAIAKADDAFDDKQYDAALTAYNEALEIKPGEKHPQERIKEINIILDARKKAEEDARKKEAAFAELVKQGDQLANGKHWEEARQSYQAALNIKDDSAVKAKLEKVKKSISNAKAETEKQNQYEAAIASADEAFSNKEYKQAKAAYEKALSIKPGEQYPKEQLPKTEKLLEELIVKKEAEEQQKAEDKKREMQYQDVIRMADQAFEKQNYEVAKALYRDALKIKEWEEYPNEKLAEIATIEAELQAAAEKSQSEDKAGETVVKEETPVQEKTETAEPQEAGKEIAQAESDNEVAEEKATDNKTEKIAEPQKKEETKDESVDLRQQLEAERQAREEAERRVEELKKEIDQIRQSNEKAIADVERQTGQNLRTEVEPVAATQLEKKKTTEKPVTNTEAPGKTPAQIKREKEEEKANLEEEILQARKEELLKKIREFAEEQEAENQTVSKSGSPIKTDNEKVKSAGTVIFRVQFMTSTKPIPLSSQKFDGLNEVWEYRDGSIYKYTAGKTTDLERATELQGEVRDQGHDGAFVVAFINNSRISMSTARELIKNQ